MRSDQQQNTESSSNMSQIGSSSEAYPSREMRSLTPQYQVNRFANHSPSIRCEENRQTVQRQSDSRRTAREARSGDRRRTVREARSGDSRRTVREARSGDSRRTVTEARSIDNRLNSCQINYLSEHLGVTVLEINPPPDYESLPQNLETTMDSALQMVSGLSGLWFLPTTQLSGLHPEFEWDCHLINIENITKR